MRVLIACEYSGRVREAFRAKGHDAWSCDLLPADDDSPYHWITQKYQNLSPGAFLWPVYKMPVMTDRMLRNQSRLLACIRRVNIQRLRHRGNRNEHGWFDRYH